MIPIKKSQFIITYIILTLLQATNMMAQVKSTGLPDVHNFTTDITQAGPQTWDIYEDSQGNVYFGNEKGVVKYDGEEWLIIPLENNSEVYSIAQAIDGNIYIGGYTEIGMITKDSIGKTSYQNLNHLIPQAYRNFSSVWKIYQTHYGIIFQSYEYIFILQDDTIRVIEPETSFGFSYYVNNNFYIVEKGDGLKLLTNGELVTLSGNPIFSNDEIRFILPFRSKDLLIGSFSNGLYILSNERMSKWNIEMNSIAIDQNLYTGSFNEGKYIFGTVKNGLYITDSEGNIIQHINRLKGLQNNTVLTHYTDSKGNLWLGLDNGLDYLKTSLPVSFMNHNFNLETVYTSIAYKDRLYVGTNQGLFSKPLDELSNPKDISFEIVENTEGQVWNLAIVDDQLLCAHNYGAFRIEGMNAYKISTSVGIWNFFRLNGVKDHLFSGSYYGLVVYTRERNGKWIQAGTINIGKSLRKIICDNDNNIWVSHDHEGLYRFRLNDDYSGVSVMEQYLDTSGLSGELPYPIHQLNDLFFVSTTHGQFTYDTIQNTFKPMEELNNFFSGHGKISYFQTDQKGNRWYVADGRLGYYKLQNDGTYNDVYSPFAMLTSFLKDNYENIYVYDYKNIFIGSVKGLIHYDPTINKDFLYETKTNIKKVEITKRNMDSILFYRGNKMMEPEQAFEQFRLSYDWNTISFKFNCPDPENTNNIQYSFRLVGQMDEWSEWTRQTTREYNNLKDGSYIFEVRSKNIYNKINESDRFAFTIETPFYRSATAYIIYLFFILGVTVLGLFYLKKRFEYIRSSEKEKHTAVFQKKEEVLLEEQMRAEREIEQLRIDKLESSMRYKNKELANSTYHIIRKNKYLNSLKQEISKLSKEAKSEFVEAELKKISRKIDRDINNEKNWEVFDRYFDEVHQEFLERLKEKHVGLSPKELRLSAYLRMNISTKEIAPLMNISVRGVEISRYRLRKKLELGRDDNLTQYLMNI